MSTARFIVADVFDGLATLEDGSVDLIVTSPPFLALRSYLPADHPEKSKEIGSESAPAEFIDVMLRVTRELRRVLAPHGSIAIELGDTYAGSGGAGGDYGEDGFHNGQPKYGGSAERGRTLREGDDSWRDLDGYYEARWGGAKGGPGWPLAKSRTLIPQLYEIALAYGINPLTGQPSPAGQWRIRNVVTWARPNPPVGALGDKWRPATSDLIVACISSKRYWDDLATRKALRPRGGDSRPGGKRAEAGVDAGTWSNNGSEHGAPLLDYWEIPPGGYQGSHYAVFPEELVVPCVKAMCPPKVCRVCGEPSRRIHQAGGGLGEVIRRAREAAGFTQREVAEWFPSASGGVTGCVWNWENEVNVPMPEQWGILKERLAMGDGWDHLLPERNAFEYEAHGDPKRQNSEAYAQALMGQNPSAQGMRLGRATKRITKLGWTDCGHDDYRPGIVLDPFAGSGTTLAVATGHGYEAIGIDLDERNLELARQRVGMFLTETVSTREE